MRAHWKPILVLLLVTPFLTELLSGSLPASEFFRPPVILFLSTVGYGFPLLLLREFAVRRRLGIIGLFVLGIVYGIFNEGILAKTFYLAANLPVRTFDGFGYFHGIAVPWAIMISVWHALHSVLYPILAIGYFFPEHRESPWLKRREIVCLAIPTVVIGSLIFFNPGKDRAAGQLADFILMLSASGLLIWLATRISSVPGFGEEGAFRTAPIFFGGLAFLTLVFVPVLLSGAKIPVMVFGGYYALLVFFMMWRLRHQTSLPMTTVLLLALGDDSLLALFGVVISAVEGNLEKLITNAIFVGVFVWFIARLRRSAKVSRTEVQTEFGN